MYIRAFAIGIFIVGLALADPIPKKNCSERQSTVVNDAFLKILNSDSNLYKYKVDSELSKSNTEEQELVFVELESHDNKTAKLHKARGKWASIKSRCRKSYEKLKAKWHKVSHKIKVTEERALKLIEETEKMYMDIVVEDKHGVYAHFEIYYAELQSTLQSVEKVANTTYKESMRLLESAKEEVEKHKILSKIASKTGRFLLWVTGLANDWEYLKKQWKKIHGDFVELFDIVIEDSKKLKNDTIVLYRGAKTDLIDLKKQMLDLLEEAKQEYRVVVKDGKESIEMFKELYNQTAQSIDDLKPVAGETFSDIRDFLVELKYNLEEFVKLRKKHEEGGETATHQLTEQEC